MNKLDILLKDKYKDLLSMYFTAGYPNLDDSREIIDSLESNGADLIEIGIPFSDPVADGPVIQTSNAAAIENGMTLRMLFEQLKSVNPNSKLPKILMGYFNPVLQYGVEKFCKDCKNVGVDGVIIPDLPVYEYETHYKSVFEEYGIHFIFLVSPQTSEERLNRIEELSTSFIYAVSTNATTGGITDFSSQKEYFQRLKDHLSKPFLIGFGVKDKNTFKTACEYANGAIVGSAFINSLMELGSVTENIESFINQLRN